MVFVFNTQSFHYHYKQACFTTKVYFGKTQQNIQKPIKSYKIPICHFPIPSFTINSWIPWFPSPHFGKKKNQTFGRSMVGEIEFIDLHRDPYTNKCKVVPKPRFWKRRSFLGWAKNGVGGNFRRFFGRLERFSITELVRFLYEFAMSFLWSLCVFFEGWFCPNLLHLSAFWLHVCSVTVPETNILATTKSDGCVAMLVSGSENGRSYA